MHYMGTYNYPGVSTFPGTLVPNNLTTLAPQSKQKKVGQLQGLLLVYMEFFLLLIAIDMHFYAKNIYRMAGNFRGIQFSRKAHLQRFRDLIFADGRSRVAPPTISIRLHLLLHVRRGSNLVGQKKKTASDRSIVIVLSRDREMAQKSHNMIVARDIILCRTSSITMNWCEVNQSS